MTQRLNALEVAKGAMTAMYGLEKYLAKCGLEASFPGTYRVAARALPEA